MDPPKKNTVIGVAVIVATKAMMIPETANFQTLVSILYLDNNPAETPIKNEVNAYGIQEGSIIPLIRFVSTPVTAAGIGPAKAPTRITPIISRSTGIFNIDVICPPTILIAIATGINRITIIENVSFPLFFAAMIISPLP